MGDLKGRIPDGVGRRVEGLRRERFGKTIIGVGRGAGEFSTGSAGSAGSVGGTTFSCAAMTTASFTGDGDLMLFGDGEALFTELLLTS